MEFDALISCSYAPALDLGFDQPLLDSCPLGNYQLDDAVSGDNSNICSDLFLDENAFDTKVPEPQSQIEKTFACILCNKSYKSLNALNRHSRAHTVSKRLNCSRCTKSFTNTTSRKVHELLHSGNKTYCCLLCGKSFVTKTILNRHMLVHTDIRPYACTETECKRSFRSVAELARHMLSHRAEKSFHCYLCTKSFIHKNSLDCHLKVHFNIYPFSCNMCKKSFLSRSQLVCHVMVKHLHNKKYKCNFVNCDKGFYRRYALKKHTTDVHNAKDKTFHCEKCSKSFVNARMLNQHSRVHTGQKPYQCKTCSKTFIEASNLSQHKKVHMKPEFICFTCGKSFKRQATLDEHILCHDEKNKIFKCELCSSSFVKKWMLVRHMKKHQDKKFICEVCNLQTERAHDLRKHLMTHEKIKPFSCEHCGKKFSRKQNMLRHAKNHEDYKYKCHNCQLQFPSEIKLAIHINSVDCLARLTPKTVFRCTICKLEFLYREDMQSHSISQHGHLRKDIADKSKTT